MRGISASSWGADHVARRAPCRPCPLAREHSLASPTIDSVAAWEDPGVPRSVLVVDDDATFRDLAARVLTLSGYHVIGEAGSVAEALARASELAPDAALV